MAGPVFYFKEPAILSAAPFQGKGAGRRLPAGRRYFCVLSGIERRLEIGGKIWYIQRHRLKAKKN